ncbi:MAG: UbiD family decarboxylase [Candidatus Diapherotrites archaeon]|nr:UbiD family decarboxylase [Candidatus Diapherotrites archaeon]
MSFRDYIKKLEKKRNLIRIKKPVSKNLEASAIINELKDKPVLFENIKESNFKVSANIFATKQLIADYFGVSVQELLEKMLYAIENPSEPKLVKNAPCQEVELPIDLDKLPILFHCEKDGGNYISSGVCIITDKEYGQNVDFHRCMQISKNKFSVRVVEGRHFDIFLKKNKDMPVAVCIGNSPNVLLAAATSVNLGQNELCIANSLEELNVVKAKTFDALIPADCEFVLEGIIRENERHTEGPFVDLTETYDIVRDEPVLEIKKITCRRDAIWQALLPGGLEHKILMGMPREPTIFKKVKDAGINCLDVSLTPGGCSWLHAVVKINKKEENDGKKTVYAAFEGHKSCKHVFVVDDDIDIYDPNCIEWALATRFQADSDLIILKNQKGSSLDPSADPKTSLTTKCGFDLTKPLLVKGKNFEKAEYPKTNLKYFLD